MRNVEITRRRFAGAGGKQGGSHTAKTDPDTLTSKQFARIKDIITEGPIKGFTFPTKPLTCVALNGTPIENPDGITYTDGTTTFNSATFTSASAPFDKSWVGRGITGDNIPLYTIVQSVESPSSLTMSQKATATQSGSVVFAKGGTLNFTNFDFYMTPGTQDQNYLPGFDSDENTISAGPFHLLHATPWTSSPISDLSIDAVRIDVNFPSLQHVVTTGTNAGDVHGTEVDIQIDVIVGGVTTTLIRDRVVGKATQPYTRTYKMELADIPGPWTFKVTRVTADAADSNVLKNETYVVSYTTVTYTKLRHPNTVVSGIHIDAQQFASIPSRSWRLKGLLVSIPKNYDPVARTYDTTVGNPGVTAQGTWDGTFKVDWTNNPAWCWNDLATNVRYGLGSYLRQSDIDKWTLYTIAQYCDGMVSDGFGGTEPRMTCNLYLQKREDAMKVLTDMAGIFRGMLYYANGQLVPVQDSPATSQFLFSPDNVINGQFNYSGTGIKARHTVAQVTWNDMSNGGAQKIEYVEDQDQITLYGQNLLSITAFGCTSRGQAHRIGVWALTLEKVLTDTVTFETGMEGFYVKPGQVISIQDPFRAGAVNSGRLKASSTQTSLVLDKFFSVVTGHTYLVQVINPATNVVMQGTVTNTGGGGAGIAYGTLTVSGLTAAPDGDSVYVITDNTLVPALYRVLGQTQKDATTCTIVALQYNASVYSVTDGTGTLQIPLTSVLPDPNVIQPPGTATTTIAAGSNGAVLPQATINVTSTAAFPTSGSITIGSEVISYTGTTGTAFTGCTGGTSTLATGEAVNGAASAKVVFVTMADQIRQDIHVSWIPSPDKFVRAYQIAYRFNSGNWMPLGNVVNPDYVLEDCKPGQYDFTIVAVNAAGKLSTAVGVSQTVLASNPLVGATVTGLEMVGLGNATAFTTPDVDFDWSINSPAMVALNNGLGDKRTDPYFQYFIVTIYQDVARTQIYQPAIYVTTNTYRFTLSANKIAAAANGLSLPLSTFTIGVKILDTFNNVSPEAYITVSKALPGKPVNPSVTPGLGYATITWTSPIDPSIAKMNIYLNSLTSAVNVSVPTTSGQQGTVDFPNLRNGGTYGFFIESEDVFGNKNRYALNGLIGNTTYNILLDTPANSGSGGYIPITAITNDLKAVVASPPGGYVPSTATSVTLSCPSQNTAIHYTTDGTTPTSASPLYTAPFNVNPAIGTPVVVTAAAFTLGFVGPVTSWTFTQYPVASPVAASPSFSPVPGSYKTADGALDVTMSTPTAADYLFYTKDGTTPAHDGATPPAPTGTTTRVAGASIVFTLPNSMTLKCLANKSGYTDSAVTSGTYTLSTAPAYGGGGGGHLPP